MAQPSHLSARFILNSIFHFETLGRADPPVSPHFMGHSTR